MTFSCKLELLFYSSFKCGSCCFAGCLDRIFLHGPLHLLCDRRAAMTCLTQALRHLELPGQQGQQGQHTLGTTNSKAPGLPP